jgi:hypothetical protein
MLWRSAVKLFLVLLSVVFSTVPAASHALLDDVAWEATRIVRVDGREFVTHVNHTLRKERISAVLGGLEVTVILRSDHNVLWQLMPMLSLAGETDISAMDTPANIRILSRERLGDEIVAGQPTVKYRARYETRSGKRQDGYFWESAAGVHLRSRFAFLDNEGALREVELELRDVKVGPQLASLFEVPETYRRVPLDGSALLAGLLGM